MQLFICIYDHFMHTYSYQYMNIYPYINIFYSQLSSLFLKPFYLFLPSFTIFFVFDFSVYAGDQINILYIGVTMRNFFTRSTCLYYLLDTVHVACF